MLSAKNPPNGAPVADPLANTMLSTPVLGTRVGVENQLLSAISYLAMYPESEEVRHQT
jgi:hypothetical protein